MYTKLLSVIAIIEIMWETIFSVLCVLKMTLKDIARSENATYFSNDGKVNIISATDVP